MNSITLFFKKFKKLTPPHYALKISVINAVQESIGIMIEKKDITITGKNIHIKNRPAVKNEIFLKKSAILERVKKEYTSIVDIL